MDEQATTPTQTPGSLDAPTSGDSATPVPPDALSVADELIETLRAANGPPTPATGQAGPSPLVAKVIHADTAGFVRTQVFYLNFDGAVGVTYNGPVRVENITIEPFQATGDLAGHEAAVISSILSALNSRFAGLGVVFTASSQGLVAPYSTFTSGEVTRRSLNMDRSVVWLRRWILETKTAATSRLFSVRSFLILV